MRLVLFALLLSIPFAYSLVVESTNSAGLHPALYGDAIAFEQDGKIFVYDLSKKELREISKGSNPSLFAFTVAFETKEDEEDLNSDGDKDDTVIQFANIRDKKITSTNAAGHHPHAFSSFITFSTKESELGIDFSNDGDMVDDIIRQYDIDKKETANLKAVGDFPVLNQHALLFLTEEKQVDADLNADGDKSDSILRVLDQDSRKVSNTKIPAESLMLAKSGNAVFVSDGEIIIFDSVEQKSKGTKQRGNSPSLFDDVVIFERDGKLFGYALKSESIANLNVVGSNPSLFENIVAFVSSEKEVGDLNGNNVVEESIVRFAREEDIDGDDAYDFVDNCAAIINEDQEDSSNNGVGDACETKKESPKPESKSESSEPQVAQNATETPVSESKGIAWYWYLLAIVLLPFVAYYGYKYYKKRQKSFGF